MIRTPDLEVVAEAPTIDVADRALTFSAKGTNGASYRLDLDLPQPVDGKLAVACYSSRRRRFKVLLPLVPR